MFHFVQTQPKKKTTDFLREEAGGFLNFPSVVWNSVSEDFIVSYTVLIYSAAIAGVALDGVDNAVFDLLDNTRMIRSSVLGTGAALVMQKLFRPLMISL